MEIYRHSGGKRHDNSLAPPREGDGASYLEGTTSVSVDFLGEGGWEGAN